MKRDNKSISSFFSISSLRIPLLLCVASLFAGCVSPHALAHRNWNVFISESYGYTIPYPADWEARQAVPRVGMHATSDSEVLLDDEVQKVTFLEKDYGLWQAEFEVKVLENPRGISLEQWARNYRVEDVTGGNLIQSSTSTLLDGRPAVRFSIFGFDHEIISVVSQYGKYFYSLTFSGSNPNDPEIEKHQRVYDGMLSGFAFLPAK